LDARCGPEERKEQQDHIATLEIASPRRLPNIARATCPPSSWPIGRRFSPVMSRPSHPAKASGLSRLQRTANRDLRKEREEERRADRGAAVETWSRERIPAAAPRPIWT